MATFKDNAGREWEVALDAPTIRKIREAHDGLDLAGVDGAAYEKLADDPILLVDVLWTICRKQAQQAEVDDEAFGRALVGDAIDGAVQALLRAISDFFPHAKRAVILAVANKNQTLRDIGMQKALSRLNDPALEKQVADAMEAIMDAEVKAALTRLSSVTSSPDLSESASTD